MYNKKNMFNKITLVGIATLTLLTISSTVATASTKPKMEKCTGIVAPGKADGQKIVNGKKVDWIFVPAGACSKFVGGEVISD